MEAWIKVAVCHGRLSVNFFILPQKLKKYIQKIQNKYIQKTQNTVKWRKTMSFLYWYTFQNKTLDPLSDNIL